MTCAARQPVIPRAIGGRSRQGARRRGMATCGFRRQGDPQGQAVGARAAQKAVAARRSMQKAQTVGSGLCIGRLAVSYFHTANAALSSALRRFTVLFGMGRRGTTSLWPPDINCLQTAEAVFGNRCIDACALLAPSPGMPAAETGQIFRFARQSLSNDRIKPHEPLVSVSFTPHSASTPDLSTSWSRTTLQEGQALREVSSSGEFPA